MDYYVDIKEDALIFLKKLDKSVREQVEKAILSLKFDPVRKGKFLGSLNSGLPFYELRIFAGGGIRVYYTILPGKVTISEIEYAGRVPVHRIGNKKSQKKDIAKMKKQ